MSSTEMSISERLDKIVLGLEVYMSETRAKANKPLTDKEKEDKPNFTKFLDSVMLRDQVWKDYNKDREDKICSRCGSYNKYEIEDERVPVAHELNSKYGHNFFLIEYKLKVTEIRNKDSLGNSAYGNICQKCHDHILGIKPYLLDSSLEDAEFELRDLRNKEHNRRLFQEDKIKEAKKKINKERRELENENKRIYPKANPNEMVNEK